MDERSRPRWYRRTWIIATATCLIGIVVGAAGGASANTDVTQSPEYRKAAKARSDAQEALAESRVEIKRLQSKLTDVQGDLPARESAVRKAEKDLRQREHEVKAREKAVAKREKAVGLVEKEIKANTISGDGIYRIGEDIKPGTYRSAGAAGCYYAVLNSADTQDIATNNITNGPAIITLPSGKYFSTTGCAKWVLQR